MKQEYLSRIMILVISVTTLGFIPDVMFPYVAGKLMIGLGGMMIVLVSIAVFIFQNKSIVKPSWITKGLWLLSVLSLVSTVWSSNVWVSIWGSDGRGEGLMLSVILSVYSWGIDHLSVTEKRRMGKGIVMISSIVTMYGVFELLRDTAHRSEGFHGNSILFAMYCLSIIALSFVLLRSEKKSWIGIPLMLSLGALLATQTRGILLAVLCAGVVWGILYIIKNSSSQKRKVIIGGLVGLMVMGVGLRYIDTHSQFFQEKLPFMHRIVSLDNTLDSDKQRVFIWNTAWKAFQERPWVGYGSQMFYEAFDTHYDARLTRYGFSQVWSDRAHNVYLDILVMYGLLGVVVYGGCLIFVMKKLRTVEKRNEIIAIMIGFGVAYVFEFTGVADTVLLVVLLHLICEPQREEKIVPKEIAVLFVIPLLSIMTAHQWYTTSQSVAFAISQTLAGDATTVALEKINTTNIFKRDYLLRMADLAFRTMQKTDADKRQADAVVAAIDQYLQKYSTDVAMIVAHANIQLKVAMIFSDEAALEKADTLYARASELAPNKQTMYLQRANGSVLKKDFEMAEQWWAHAYELDPDNHMIEYQFGYALLSWGRLYEGSTVLRGYFNRFASENMQFVPNNEKELSVIAQSALQINNIDLLAYALAGLLKQNNQNSVAKENLERARASGQLQEITVKGIEKFLQK